MKFVVKLCNLEDISLFTQICSRFECGIDLKSGKYVVDAKSYLGVAGMGARKLVIVHILTDDKDIINEFRKEIERYMVNK